MIVLSDTHAPPPRRKRKQIFDDYAGEDSTLKQREHGYRWLRNSLRIWLLRCAEALASRPVPPTSVW
jgi:hypothetical protein